MSGTSGISCLLLHSFHFFASDIEPYVSTMVFFAILRAFVIGMFVLWSINLIMHQIYHQRRWMERRRLRALQERFGMYGTRPWSRRYRSPDW